MGKSGALWLAEVLFAALLAATAAAPAMAAKVTLSGEVTYLERMALPRGALLRVRLLDLTEPGTPARVEAEAPISFPGQVPLTFTLYFDDRAIDATHEHALVAEISAESGLLFRNEESYRLDPLAPEGPVLIVTRFVGNVAEPADGGEARDIPAPTAILEITWQAEAIGGDPVSPDIASTLSIAGDMRAGGRGGCNNYFTQAMINGESIRFSAVAATQMACVSTEATLQEERFFSALGEARFWQMRDERLVLLDAGGRELVLMARSAI